MCYQTISCACLFVLLSANVATAQLDFANRRAEPRPVAQAAPPAQLDRATAAKQLYETGVSQHRQGQFSEALPTFQAALSLFKELDNQQAIATTLNNLGLVCFKLGQMEQALQLYQEALAVNQTARSLATEASIRNNLGTVYNQLGEYTKALELLQQALTIAQNLPDPLVLSTTLNNIGETYRQLGQYAKALEFYQQSLARQTITADYAGQISTLNNTAVLYHQLGQPTKAQGFLQQALTIQQAHQLAEEPTTLINLGLSYRQQQQPMAALKVYQQALKIQASGHESAGFSATLVDIGSTYAEIEDYANALKFYQQALGIQEKLANPSAFGATLINLGWVLAKTGDEAKAMQVYQQALDLFTKYDNPVGRGKVFHGMGVALFQTGQFGPATERFLQAIAIWEAQRPGLTDANRVSLFDTQSQTFQYLQRSLVAQGDFSRALVAAERGRARAFVELLAGRSLPGGAAPAALPTLAAIQQVAKAENATLVEYSIIPDRHPLVYIWIVRPSGEVSFQSVPLTLPAAAPSPSAIPVMSLVDRQVEPNRGGTSTKIAEVVRGTLDALGAIGRDGLTATGSPITEAQQLRHLHQLLIAPIAAQLPTDPERPVIFIPQGPLFQIPFAALPDAQGVALIEHHTMLMAPSIQSLAIIHQQRQAPTGANQVLVVGNPAVASVTLELGKPPQVLANLPGAEQEAQQIATLFKTQALLGKAATKTAVIRQMESARIIHLATHGFLDDVKGTGMPGAIALTPTTNPLDSGLLTADEILTQKLQAELVVLSACDTGRGTITGDGVIGLSRSLLSAGTPSVIVSLWKVPDTPTALLMQEFYQQWLSHPDLGKARALRQAMLKTKQVYPAPLAWAAFTLIGVAK